MASDVVVEARGLRKTYGDHEAVRGVDLTACFDPATTGSGFSSDLWSLVGWTVVGIVIATRRFRVEMTAAGGDARRPATA